MTIAELKREECRVSFLVAAFITLAFGLFFSGGGHAQQLSAAPTLPLQACVERAPNHVKQAAFRPIGLPNTFAVQSSASAPVGLPTPAINGSCKTLLEVNKIGAATAFWCEREEGVPPQLALYAVRWSAIKPEMVTDFGAIALPGSDTAGKIMAMHAKYQTDSVWDMCDVWGPMREKINASMPATKPKPQWVVDVNRTATDRPSYAVVNSVRKTSSSTRVNVGATCNCTLLKFVEGATTYCSVGSNLVAACVQKK